MTLKKYSNSLRVLHAIFCISLLISIVIIFSTRGDFAARMSQQNIFIYIVPLVAATGYFVSKILFLKQLKVISKDAKLHQKISEHQKAVWLKYILIVAPSIMAIMAYYQSGNALHLVIAIALIAYFIGQRPSLDKIKKELPLTYSEQNDHLHS